MDCREDLEKGVYDRCVLVPVGEFAVRFSRVRHRCYVVIVRNAKWLLGLTSGDSADPR